MDFCQGINPLNVFTSAGNRLFGIKFKVSPVIFEKKINFSEYREYIFPLSYLLDQRIINKVKAADDFDSRVDVLTSYFLNIVQKNSGSITTHTKLLRKYCTLQCHQTILQHLCKAFAEQYNISTRTLQRYFETHHQHQQ